MLTQEQHAPSRSRSWLARVEASLLASRWQSVVWGINGVFIAVTIVYPYLPDNRRGLGKLLALFSLQFEKNLATYWEAWCLLLIALLALERCLNEGTPAPSARQAWAGVAVLAAALSLDELGSLHERADFLFAPWGFSGRTALLPLALPAAALLGWTLGPLARLSDRRAFWLTLGACAALGSVAAQEHLEHALRWPWWVKGLRFGVEEGTELAGVFLLFAAVLAPTTRAEPFTPVVHLFPRRETLLRLKPAVGVLTLLGVVPLGLLTVRTLAVTDNRGIPAAWLPFVLLNLAGLVAWARAQAGEAYRRRFVGVALLALFFALDQIIVFQRVVDMSLLRGEVERLMFPCLAAVCLSISPLRTRRNVLVTAALLPWSLLVLPASALLPTLTTPFQALGLFWLVASGVTVATPAAPTTVARRRPAQAPSEG
jgi:hypothetical protein